MGTQGLERILHDVEGFRRITQELEENPTEEALLMLPLLKAATADSERIIRAVERGDPWIASWYSLGPEIMASMELPWYCIGSSLLVGPILGLEEHYISDLEACDRLDIPTDSCTLLRLAVYALEAGLVPRPTAILGSTGPCDSFGLYHDAIRNRKEWRDVPMFTFDPAYWNDERSLAYAADQLRDMVSFVEEHTGKKLDMDRLRQIVEETNKQYELWGEYNELRRAVPCPHGSFVGFVAFAVTQNSSAMVGSPVATSLIEGLVFDAEERVREGRGAVEDERIRLLWFDVRPTWSSELTQWLEQECQANVVMDMYSFCPYTAVDTSTEESMFRDLAKRYVFDMPMARQARGLAENFIQDIVRNIEDFKINCFFYPGHMGHKDAAASLGIMRKVCQNMGVPFLAIGMDAWDPRYTTVDTMKEQMAQFFETIEFD
jgi:benzoyl-CoA reductase/2-hydroxyglutaryl-CoA dehydratase subunit BcrC/BadD/HgdB